MSGTWRTALRHAAAYAGRPLRDADADDEEAVEESGFTLIELMVVLLIMGILMAIAIPTFLGVTSTANDRSTQSNLTNAMTSAKSLYAQAGGYKSTTTIVKTLKSAEPEFSYVTTASSKQTSISVLTNSSTTTPPTGKVLYMAAWMTKTTVCWVAKDTEGTSGGTSGVRYSYLTTLAYSSSSKATCKASKAPTLASTKWHTGWPTASTGH